jgi:two-component system chemotaxis response regulator CheB
MTGRRVRVLIVDDSLFMRLSLRRLLSGRPEFEVVGEASDGAEAVAQALSLRPDVCSMDMNMPGTDGAEAVREIMRRCPTPVVMFSAHTREGEARTIACLAAGAVDFVTKPAGEVSADLSGISEGLARKLLLAAGAAPGGAAGSPAAAASTGPGPRRPLSRAGLGRVAFLALSTGGPALLSRVVPLLRAESKPIVVVQHMPAGFTRALAERLDRLGAVRVREAEGGDVPARGVVLVAPGDRHLLVQADGSLQVTDGPEVHGVRPAADLTLRSAARAYRQRAMGLVLTGMGRDGTEGLAAIRAAGGATYAQDRESSLLWGMPRSAIEAGVVDRVVGIDELPDLLSDEYGPGR